MGDLTRITKDQWESFKHSTKVDQDLQATLNNSLKVHPVDPSTAPVGALVAGASVGDCVNFNFDIKIIKIEGTICKSGKLDFKASVIGIQVGHTTIDLSAGGVCFNPSIGVEEIKYCFELKGSCLYTNGYVDGWFHKKQSWDEKIVCF